MRTFCIAFIDDDTKTFSYSMPIVDDTKVNSTTALLQANGRNVRIETVETSDDLVEVEEFYNKLGYTFDIKTSW